ncbi:hypothetical protein, partial [Rhodoblastus acidophilus]|uniref:hypothetical protein n=1 Tax=Rhodoblastus acidophilus TaxID=1074 RepID=UPI001FE0DC21
MQIDHAKQAFMRLLQRDKLDDGPEIIAEMQITSRLDAGKHAFGEVRHDRTAQSETCGLMAVEDPTGKGRSRAAGFCQPETPVARPALRGYAARPGAARA